MTDSSIAANTVDFLNRGLTLHRRIEKNRERIAELRGICFSPNTASLSRERVQSSRHHDPVAGMIANIVDLEAQLEADIADFVHWYGEARTMITRLEDFKLRSVLLKRYLNFQTWKQIAVDLGLTFQWVHVLHKKALSELEKVTR